MQCNLKSAQLKINIFLFIQFLISVNGHFTSLCLILFVLFFPSVLESDSTEIVEGRYIKGDPLRGYYDFIITEGSYKFWAVFQVNIIKRCYLFNIRS